MHRALLIAEILHSICDVADERTLSGLARCCKAIHEPAMQVLWRIVPNLIPLIKCFPTDIWTIEDRKIKFARIPCPAEWSTFLRNAKLVRRLGCDYDYSRGIHENIMETLSSVRPVLVLFPHVRTLTWEMRELGGYCLPSILSMVGDLVTTIRINGLIPGHILGASLAMIAPRMRHLRDLHINLSGLAAYADISSVISALFCSLTSLTTFGSYGISLPVNAIKSLAESKTIRDLVFHLPCRANWSSVRFPSQSFTSLTVLNLSCMSEAYIAFSKATVLPHLAALTLYIKVDLEPELISELFISVRRQCSPASLRTLLLYRALDDYDEVEDELLVRGVNLQPLWDFTRMERFELSMGCNYAFDDASLLNLASAWPQLRELDLATEYSYVQTVFPSLAGLLPIVFGCQGLESLRLPFDASDDITEELYGRVMDAAATSRATLLHVGSSPIEHPHSVALFLAFAFPEVEELLYGDFDAAEDIARWEEVQRYLPMFKSVRDHERLRTEQKMRVETATFQP